MKHEQTAPFIPSTFGFFSLTLSTLFSTGCEAPTPEVLKSYKVERAERWVNKMVFVRSPHAPDLCFGFSASSTGSASDSGVLVPCEKVEHLIIQP